MQKQQAAGALEKAKAAAAAVQDAVPEPALAARPQHPNAVREAQAALDEAKAALSAAQAKSAAAAGAEVPPECHASTARRSRARGAFRPGPGGCCGCPPHPPERQSGWNSPPFRQSPGGFSPFVPFVS